MEGDKSQAIMLLSQAACSSSLSPPILPVPLSTSLTIIISFILCFIMYDYNCRSCRATGRRAPRPSALRAAGGCSRAPRTSADPCWFDPRFDHRCFDHCVSDLWFGPHSTRRTPPGASAGVPVGAGVAGLYERMKYAPLHEMRAPLLRTPPSLPEHRAAENGWRRANAREFDWMEHSAPSRTRAHGPLD